MMANSFLHLMDCGIKNIYIYIGEEQQGKLEKHHPVMVTQGLQGRRAIKGLQRDQACRLVNLSDVLIFKYSL